MLDTQMVATLIETMREQWKVLQDLVEIGHKKTEVLIEGKLPELDVLVTGEQTLLVQMNRLESKRFELQQALAVELGLQPEDLTFTRLINEASSVQADVLRQLQGDYQLTVARLNSQQQTNADLISQAMQYVNFSLQVMTGTSAKKSTGTYTAQGSLQGADGARSIKRMDGRA